MTCVIKEDKMITTYLLILSVIFNIFTLISIFNLKHILNQSAENKSEGGIINKLANGVKNSLSIDDGDLDIDDTKDLKEKEADEVDYIVCDKFKDVYELLDYVSKHNLEIIDIKNKKQRKIKYLDKCTYNNKQSVLMTFDDDSEAVFKPNLYAKNIII